MKNKNTLKKIIVFCLSIVFIELLIMGIMKLTRERKVDRINMVNDIVKVDDGYILVGVSDFHSSKYIKENIYEYSIDNTKQNIISTQSRIAKYDNNMKIIWENTYKNIYDSTFNSIIKVNDGYVVVGSYVANYTQLENNTTTALIVKYDLNGNKVWENTYSVLANTEFNKVIDDGDSYIVIGQSIYENTEIGTHITGGGIIVRYTLDGKEIAHNNYGGNKSGKFNDIVKVDDGYIVCGKDATNYGIIVKFKKDFNRSEDDLNIISNKVMWQRTYANTDNIGFTSMVIVDNKIYAVGAINVSESKNEFKYDAGIIVYDINGKYINKYLLGDSIYNRFNYVLYDENDLYLSMILDIEKNSSNRSIIMKYDIINNKFIKHKTVEGSHDYIINKLVRLDKKIMYIGTSNDKCNLFGCDYQNLYETYNLDK